MGLRVSGFRVFKALGFRGHVLKKVQARQFRIIRQGVIRAVRKSRKAQRMALHHYMLPSLSLAHPTRIGVARVLAVMRFDGLRVAIAQIRPILAV